MRKKYNIIIIALSIFMWFMLSSNVMASNVTIYASSENIKKEETFSIYVKSDNLELSALTMQLYFDNTKIEYIGEDKNINQQENKLIYMWVDENGGRNKRQNEEIIELKFKAKENGIATISANGEFYNSSGEKIEMNITEAKVKIENIEEINNNEENNIDINVSENNASLKIMRLDKEGITPEFDPNTTDYYITVDSLTDNLKVTAISENPEATVEIKGNNNLKNGINLIEIIVTSKDKTQTLKYNINVTKTAQIELANTNLENLAIENAVLFPEFNSNITQYETEVATNITNLNILAIPEKAKSQVRIQGQNNLKYGSNTVTIKVIAENGITEKTYTINVYKRNEQEEIIEKEEEELKIEKVNAILEEKGISEIEQNEDIKEEIIDKHEKKSKDEIMILFVILLAIILTVIIIKNKRK